MVNAETAKINIEALAQLFVYLGRKEKQIFKTLLEDSTKGKNNLFFFINNLII